MAENVLICNKIVKTYPGVVAVNDVTFEIEKGEVHALIGENGAGKSTLIKICSGAETPTSGTVIVNGNEFKAMTPTLAEKNGIAVVYQELNLVENMTVYENLFLGHAIRKGPLVNTNEMIQKTQEMFDMMGVKITPTDIVSSLSVGFKQMIEIAKALRTNAKVIIMDEPTAALSSSEVETLFRLIRQIKDRGVAVIYISHRLNEMFEISDRVTVLRDGHLIKTMKTTDTNRNEVIRLMVGRELSNAFPPKSRVLRDEVVFQTENLTGNGDFNLNLLVKRGEILGIAGLIGAGRTEFAHMAFGAVKANSGRIILHGENVKLRRPKDAISKGVALIPEDRKVQGTLLSMSVADNITMASLKRISKMLVIDRKREKEIVETYVDRLKIKTYNPNQLLKNLSGGNQQKVALAKWMATEADLFVFDEPTRGIDVGAKYEIYLLMDAIAAQGKAIIMISSDLEELLGMSDRLVVMAEGHITGELSADQFSQEAVLELASPKRD